METSTDGSDQGGVIARPWSKQHVLALAGITLLAGVLRFVRLDDPADMVFDEHFYARDSCLYAGLEPATCTGVEHLEVHPPLGKWLIALGIRALGYDAEGWRLAAAVAGTLTVALVFLLARRLFSSLGAASLVGGAFALDPLHFVQSRVAMLDVFVTLFSVLAFTLLAHDRDRILKGGGSGLNGLRIGIGAACGAALATKWSGALALLGVMWLSVAWSATRHASTSSFLRMGRALQDRGTSLVIALVVVPLLVYAGSFALVPPSASSSADGGASWAETFLDRQIDMINFHRHTQQISTASSPAWSWPLIKRPVAYFAQKDPQVKEVWFGGNPAVWWPALIAMVYAAFRWARRQDPRTPEGFILVGFAALYLPWLILTEPPFTWGRDQVFIFYLLPALPFMYLALIAAIVQLQRRWTKAAATAAALCAAVGGFVFFYPILTAVPISEESWLARVQWFDSCDRPPPRVLVFPAISDEPPASLTLRSDNPPLGWCWK